MVDIFNSSLEIGGLINHTTLNVTGDVGLTLLLIVILLLMIALLFRTPIVLVGLIILPVFFVFAEYDYTGLFYTILVVFGLIIAWQFAKIIMSWGK